MSLVVDLTEILTKAQDPDPTNRNQAEQQLKQLQQHNAASYLLSLATELANDQKPEPNRQMAGLVLKNALDAIGLVVKTELSQRWQGLDAGVKQQIHQLLLRVLPTQAATARHTAALVIAKIAAIELPGGGWPELIPTLLTNMNAQPPNPGLRQSTLESLGYICEEMGKIEEDVLAQEQINAILTSVVEGMRGSQQEIAIRLAATTALFNALEFAQSNFDNDNERNYIMQVVCEGTISPTDVRIRESSFECLVKIASLYYAKLPSYMSDIFNLSSRAIKEDEEDVAKQAIEFWCTIAEEELELRDQLTEASEGDSAVVTHHFIKAALQQNLVALLLEQLLKQDEDQDKEDTIWNIAMAAGTCLELVATVVEDDIIPLVMPFVQDNISRKSATEDWRNREAATFAFGSILEGPTVRGLAPLVQMGLDFFLVALKDPNSQVRHTTAWTLGRVFEFVIVDDSSSAVVSPRNISKIVPTLLESLQDEPHIAEKVCYAFSELAAASKGEGEQQLLTPYFQGVITALLQTAARRPDGTTQYDTIRIQTQAFEAINEMVRSASSDSMPLVGHLIPVILQQLAAALDPAQTTGQNSPSDLQGLLCGVLQVITQRLAEAEQTKVVLDQADQIMEALLRVLSSNQATVQEEALLAVGALTYALGHDFIKYMPAFYPYLERGLSQYQEYQVCEIAIGVLGDICRALEHDVLQYCDTIMGILLTNLQSEEVQRNVKPLILSSFSDIALATGKDFNKYLSHVLSILQSAQGLCAAQQQSGDNDQYLNALRKSIFEAYSGVFQGLPRELVQQSLTSHASTILAFGEFVYSDQRNRADDVTKALISLLGDQATQIEGVGVLFNTKAAFINSLLMEAKYSNNPDLVETANWASGAIGQAIQNAPPA